MDNRGDSKECSANDLTGRKTAWFIWYVPILLVIVGSSWSRGRVWLWVPAFAVMGVGCLANAVRCGRMHCYFTGPLFILAAIFVALSGLGVVSLHPGLFLLDRLECVLPRGMCRDSVGQIPKTKWLISLSDTDRCIHSEKAGG